MKKWSAIAVSLARDISPARYAHCLATAKLGLSLARNWQVAGWRARLAGLVHDCARELSKAELVEMVSGERQLIPVERAHPLMLHGEAGALQARRRYGIRDRAVLRAVGDHVAAGPSMPVLSRLLYVADMAAEGRAYALARALRLKVADCDPEEAFRLAVGIKLRYLRKASLPRHPLSEALARDLGLR